MLVGQGNAEALASASHGAGRVLSRGEAMRGFDDEFERFLDLPRRRPCQSFELATSVGQEVQRLKFLIFGIILVLTMLLRPQGLIPSRVRQQELTKGVHEDQTLEDVTAETTA